MSIAEPTFVSVAHAGGLACVEQLVHRVFGPGDRPPGWFARKCDREGVDPHASVVAIRPESDPQDAANWLGYGLVGNLPSWDTHARTSGLGLAREARGRGWGGALLQAMFSHARANGATAITIPAVPQRVGFFAKHGLQERARTTTLLAFATGHRTRPGSPPSPWLNASPRTTVSAWFREAWERTPLPQRYTAHVCAGSQAFDVSMEGIAHVAFRWRSDEGDPQALLAGAQAWRAGLPSGTPMLIHELPAVSSVTAILIKHGWTQAQTTIAMGKALSTVA